MNVNEKGNLGLIKVIADLYNRGLHCYTPFDDYSPVDLIALDMSGKVTRIQVKYRSPDKVGRYEVSARSVVNGVSRPIDKTMIDKWAIYLSDKDKVVYLPVDIMEGKGVHYITEKNYQDMNW